MLTHPYFSPKTSAPTVFMQSALLHQDRHKRSYIVLLHPLLALSTPAPSSTVTILISSPSSHGSYITEIAKTLHHPHSLDLYTSASTPPPQPGPPQHPTVRASTPPTASTFTPTYSQCSHNITQSMLPHHQHNQTYQTTLQPVLAQPPHSAYFHTTYNEALSYRAATRLCTCVRTAKGLSALWGRPVLGWEVYTSWYFFACGWLLLFLKSVFCSQIHGYLGHVCEL